MPELGISNELFYTSGTNWIDPGLGTGLNWSRVDGRPTQFVMFDSDTLALNTVFNIPVGGFPSITNSQTRRWAFALALGTVQGSANVFTTTYISTVPVSFDNTNCVADVFQCASGLQTAPLDQFCIMATTWTESSTPTIYADFVDKNCIDGASLGLEEGSVWYTEIRADGRELWLVRDQPE
jgi:hypothetical protein